MGTDDKFIEFQVTDWDHYHYQDNDENDEYRLRVFGRNEKDESVYLEMLDFLPYFYIKIEDGWRREHIVKIIDTIKNNVYPKKNNLLNGFHHFEIVSAHDFFGFTNFKNFYFAKLYFTSFDSMRAYDRVLKKKIYLPFISKKKKKILVYESNILPILRVIHLKDLKSVGWIRIPKSKTKNHIKYPLSHCKHNYSISWKYVGKSDNPTMRKFVIASCDIECKSAKGNFPQPKNPNDPCVQIGFTLHRYGEDECYEKYIITLKETSPIPGVTVISCKTEKELLLKFRNLIISTDPDVITGFNIMGFDFKYLYHRSVILGIQKEFSQFSRIKNESCEYVKTRLASSALGENKLKYYKMTGRIVMDVMKVAMRDYKLDGYSLASVASNFIKDKVITYTNSKKSCIVKTDNTYGMAKGQYISISYQDGITTDKYKDGKKFKVLDMGKDFLKIKGNIDNNEFPEDFFITTADKKEFNKKYKLFWCQTKNDMTAKELFRMVDGTNDERAEVAKYCIQDCELCNKLVNKLQIITNNMSMAIVCNVPLSYLFLRGQGIKIQSLVAKKCMQCNHLIPTLRVKQLPSDNNKNDKKNKKNKNKKDDNDKEDNKQENNKKENKKKKNSKNKKKHENVDVDDHDEEILNRIVSDLNNKNNNDDEDDEDEANTGYEGAIVIAGENGLQQDPVYVLDYSSLYPSIMIFLGLSPEMCVLDKKYMGIDGYIYHVRTYKNNDGTFQTVIFVQKKDANGNISHGILPQILIELLTNRKNTRKQMENESDAFKRSILDGMQLAFKVTANSLYGQTGASTSPICFKRIAATTTKTGRDFLQFSKHFVEHYYSELIELATTNEKKFYKRANELYDKYQHMVKLDNGSEVCVSSDPNARIPDDKFNRNEIGYEIDKKIYEKYPEVFDKLFDIDPNNFTDVKDKNEIGNDKVKKIFDTLMTITYKERKEFSECLTKNILSMKKKKKTIYSTYSELFTKMDITKDGFYDFYTTIISKDSEYINKFITHYNTIFDNLGYKGRDDFFNKIYDTMNNLFVDVYTEMDVIYGDTDSVFVRSKIIDRKTNMKLRDKRALGISINLGIWGSIMITAMMPPPMAQEYEKVLFPLMLIAKKKYVGNLYEKNVNKFYQKSMGVVLKRRDNAPIVKIVCGGIVDQILNKNNPKGAVEFTENTLKKIITGKYNLDKFIFSKTLRENYAKRSSIVHAVLADRIAKRDPGNKPQANDRIPFAYIVNKPSSKIDRKKQLQGERVETPEFIIKNNLKIDYLFYITNQIMNPAIQFLELIVDNPEVIFGKYIVREKNIQNKVRPVLFYNTKKDDSDCESLCADDLDNDLVEFENENKKQRQKQTKNAKPNKFNMGKESVKELFAGF